MLVPFLGVWVWVGGASCRYSGPGSFLTHAGQSSSSWLFVRPGLVNWPVPAKGADGGGSLGKPVKKTAEEAKGRQRERKGSVADVGSSPSVLLCGELGDRKGVRRKKGAHL